MKNLTISNELLISRWGDGVKLLTPEKVPTGSPQLVALQNIADLPLHVFFYDTQSKFRYLNEKAAIDDGFISANDAIGKSVRHVAKKDSAEKIIQNILQF